MSVLAHSKPIEEWIEKDLDRALFAQKNGLAISTGWRLNYHTLSSRGSQAGFPDRVLVRERVIFAELKSPVGYPTPAQRVWLNALAAAGAEVYLLRPRDLGEFSRVLQRRWVYRDGELHHGDESWRPACMWPRQ